MSAGWSLGWRRSYSNLPQTTNRNHREVEEEEAVMGLISALQAHIYVICCVVYTCVGKSFCILTHELGTID